MALEMLMEFGSKTMPNVSHKPKHDLEPIIYVLVWMCVLYSHPNGPQNQPIPAQETCL
ncbi:hypothetical protein JVU11DRAFT_10547 [Chiua virens]|nr:hypothetical protein JVU11DRAFT_10547 [Chiua virens]